jgi:hypothetical protein
MLRKFLAVMIAVTLCWTTVACSSSSSNSNRSVPNPPPQVTSGTYPVQQATYNDADGEYTLMLLNTPAGTPPTFRTTNLQMARLTEAEIAQGKTTYVDIQGEQGAMHLTEDFKIEYVHNVTETRNDPQTGQPQTVVVRRESSFWTPFAGALAGQALGNLLFTPQYYLPPVYQSGGVLRGYGGYGSNYNQAVERYQTRYKTSPPVVTNRQVLRTTGNLRTPSSRTTPSTNPPSSTSNQPSGSGYGSSKLRSSGKSTPQPRGSFGSSTGSRGKSFSRSRRRR